MNKCREKEWKGYMTHEKEITLVSCILNLLVLTFYLMDTKWFK